MTCRSTVFPRIIASPRIIATNCPLSQVLRQHLHKVKTLKNRCKLTGRVEIYPYPPPPPHHHLCSVPQIFSCLRKAFITVIVNFHVEQATLIRRRCWKEHLKISNRWSLRVISFKIANIPNSVKVALGNWALGSYCLAVTQVKHCIVFRQPSVIFLEFSDHFFAISKDIALKLCYLTDFKVLFSAVSTNCRYLLYIKI